MIPLENMLLAAFSCIGFIGFIVGLAYSLKNDQLTKYASSIWFIFCVGMSFACLWSLAASLGYLGIGFEPEVFMALDNIFLACFASFLLAVTYLSFMGDVKLM